MTNTKKGSSLINKLDDYFEMLLSESQGVKTGGDEAKSCERAQSSEDIGFLDRLKVFQAGVHWVAVKYKIDPEGDDDEFSKLRKSALGGTRGSGRGPAAS